MSRRADHLTPAPPSPPPSYGCCGFRDWLTYGWRDPLRWHVTADLMGGAAAMAIAHGPWFAPAVREVWWARLLVVALLAAYWQYQNKKEIAGYRWDYVAFDFTWTVASAGLADLLSRVVLP